MRLEGAAAVPAQRKRRPKDIGTEAETAVVRVMNGAGWPHAERRALRGNLDCGDITGCPGLVIEVKGGKAAKTASDGQVTAWLDETETERVNARADIGVLVMARAGIGPANAHMWWAIVHSKHFNAFAVDCPVRLHLGDALAYLRELGYGGVR